MGAFSQYPRRVKNPAEMRKSNSIIHHDRRQFTHMGYSIRTSEWRYTEWVAWNGTTLRPIWNTVAGRELYDHRNESAYPTDFDARENENVAPQNEELVATLSKKLKVQFGDGRPN